MRHFVLILALTIPAVWSSVCLAEPPERAFGDFAWMHGANYTPSYAATDVETWLHYDPVVIDRELGYAQQIGLNCVRVFLQSLVYEHAPEKFLADFADFVATADRHGLKVMPILFDSCFGIAPSLESQHMWVANPGPDRMNETDFEALDAYVRAVVTPYVGDRRIALWDVMNEPTVTVLSLTEEGKAQIWTFVRHFGQLVHELDSTHAITSGVAGWDNAPVIDLVDVLSCHSYAPTRDEFREALTKTQRQAREAGKPWIVSECCAPGWGNPYEMVLPQLREFAVGHTVWEVMIGKNQFAPISGLFYPDGTVRSLTSVEAVTGRSIAGLTEKSKEEGIPIARQRAGRSEEYVRFMARNEVTAMTWRERNTAVAALVAHGLYGPDAPDVLKQLEDARKAHQEGREDVAYSAVGRLLVGVADVLTQLEKAPKKEKEVEPAATIELPSLGPWTNPFSEHPLFKQLVAKWEVSVEQQESPRRLTWETLLSRSTDYPLSVGADWSGTVPTDELILDAENHSTNSVNIGVVLVTEDDDRITYPPRAVPPGERRSLIFDMLDADPRQQPDHEARLRRLEIVIRNIRARVPYRVSVGTLKFRQRRPLEPVDIAANEFTGSAGQDVTLEWPVVGGTLPEQMMPVALTIERQAQVFLKAAGRIITTNGTVQLEPVSIRLPQGMPGGSYEVFADTRQLRVAGQPPRHALVGRLTVQASPGGPLISACIAQHHGAPAIVLNGKPTNGLMYMTYALEERYLRPFADAGVELFSFDTCCGFHPYDLTSTTWPALDKVDFSQCDAHATRVLSACPDAKLLIRCYVACPPWWATANPDECMVAMTAENKTIHYEEKPGFRPGSWASQKWRSDMGEILRRFVQHLRGSCYADRIVGLMVCAGVTEEWMMFGSNTGGVLTDYSAPAKAAFRAWVGSRYETEELLRAAWHDSKLSFDSVEPPSPHEIAAAAKGDFLDPSRGGRIADWWRFLSDLTADTIEHYAHIVKKQSGGDWLCGAFYGYVVQFHEPRILTAGHLAIDRLTRSPYLDYFFSPALYSHRSLKPGGFSTSMSLVDSYHVHGKLWCNENDLRTFRVMDVPNVKADQIDRRQTPRETIALLRRQLGSVLADGCGHSYFDMAGGWYDDPRLAAEIRSQVAVANRALQMDRSSAGEVAVVIEPDAFTGQALHTQVNTWLVLGQIAALGNMGTPFDLVTLRDMEMLSQRKLWVFLNLFDPTPEQIDAIHRRLKADRAMGLFVYAAGYQGGPRVMRQLTGMTIVADEERRVSNITASGERLGIHADVTYGTSSPVGPASFGEGQITPIFHVDDDQAEILGYDTVSGRPALCVKKMEGWTSAYSAAPCVAASVMRSLAKRAGVHFYVHEDAVVYANRSLLSVTVVEPGTRTISLPHPMRVEDAFQGECLIQGATHFDVSFAERESRLFFLTP